jgi:hypothetical protein
MADHERPQPTEPVADDPRLPVPLGDRRPAVRPSGGLSADPATALARAVIRAPLLTAAAVGAAAMSGAVAASRLLWPWLAGRGAGPSNPWTWASRPGPGVHVSYTHIELHWPLDR